MTLVLLLVAIVSRRIPAKPKSAVRCACRRAAGSNNIDKTAAIFVVATTDDYGTHPVC
jgi:hypothetical protein